MSSFRREVLAPHSSVACSDPRAYAPSFENSLVVCERVWNASDGLDSWSGSNVTVGGYFNVDSRKQRPVWNAKPQWTSGK